MQASGPAREEESGWMAVNYEDSAGERSHKKQILPIPGLLGGGRARECITSDSEKEGWPPSPLQHPHKVTVHQCYKYTYKILQQ